MGYFCALGACFKLSLSINELRSKDTLRFNPQEEVNHITGMIQNVGNMNSRVGTPHSRQKESRCLLLRHDRAYHRDRRRQ
jgi:hypothetical protein